MNKAEGGNHTVCPGSSGPFYIVTYYIKWVTTSLTYRKSAHISQLILSYGHFYCNNILHDQRMTSIFI